MQMSQRGASRNLGILRDAGLLKARRDRPSVLYSIDEGSREKSYKGLAGVI